MSDDTMSNDGSADIDPKTEAVLARYRSYLQDDVDPREWPYAWRTEINRGGFRAVDFLMDEEEAWAELQVHIGWKRDNVKAELERGMQTGQFRQMDLHASAVNLMHATKAFQMPQSLMSWREPETILPELDGVLDLVFGGLRK